MCSPGGEGTLLVAESSWISAKRRSGNEKLCNNYYRVDDNAWHLLATGCMPDGQHNFAKNLLNTLNARSVCSLIRPSWSVMVAVNWKIRKRSFFSFFFFVRSCDEFRSSRWCDKNIFIRVGFRKMSWRTSFRYSG